MSQSPDSSGPRVHFNGLNGIRAIAALVVAVFHIDQHMPQFGRRSIGFGDSGMAGYGVVLFFVLSGYLITYLLLVEKERFGGVSLRKFYGRRILRIWPLYYLVIAVSLLLIAGGVLPRPEDLVRVFVPYAAFVANVAYAMGIGYLTITPLWSVGVEEQFYAFWPVMVGRARRTGLALWTVIGVYLVVKLALRVVENDRFYMLASLTAFDCMAIGGLAALMVFRRHPMLTLLFKPAVQVVAWGFLLWSIFVRPVHVASIVDNEIHSVAYAVLVLNVSANPKTLITLEGAALNFLGRISYGLYGYHMLVVALLALAMSGLSIRFDGGIMGALAVQALCLGSTIGVAALSHRFVETPFLRFKDRLSRVQSAS